MNRVSPPLALALVTLFSAGAAHAWPVDLRVEVEQGKEHFQKLASVDWVESESAGVALAEILPSGELMVTGVSPGKTLLLLYAEGRFAVWRIDVTESGASRSGEARRTPPALLLEPARKLCADFRFETDAPRLSATVKDDACRKALLSLLEGEWLLARELELTFTLEALQAQLTAVEAALAGAKLPLRARYLGAGLVLEGALPNAAARRQALWAVFKNSVGRVPLEDRMTQPPEPAKEKGGQPSESPALP